MNVRIGIAILQMTHDRDASLYNVNNRVSNEKHTLSFSFFFFFFFFWHEMKFRLLRRVHEAES